MTKYRYLIVGGGMTAAAAIEEIREADKEGSIGLISAEPNPPYDRPPLSKDLWKGDDLDSIWRETPEQQVDLHLGRKVTHLDIKNKRVIDDHKNEYKMRSCCSPLEVSPKGFLLATIKSFTIVPLKITKNYAS